MDKSFTSFEEEIEKIFFKTKKAFSEAKNAQELYDLKVDYLGKKGKFSQMLQQLRDLPKDIKPRYGSLLNKKKSSLENIYLERKSYLENSAIESQISSEKMDLSLPGPFRFQGGFHPVFLVIKECVEILSRIGYSTAHGPLIEKDFYNFEALNISKDHPSRDLQDTFYIDDEYMLRTHTSPVQIHVLEEREPPLRILSPGSVFRCDSDISHSPHFHQLEGLLVENKVSMADLKGTIAYFIQNFLSEKTEIRFRPSFFPFTEPSAEVDASCPLCVHFSSLKMNKSSHKKKLKDCSMCKGTGWVEVGGCGLVHPHVFESVGLSSKTWQGFAFGFGIERLAIIKYEIEDIRLFSENDLSFLKQFVNLG